MTSKKRENELSQITEIEHFLNSKHKEEKESSQLFDKKDIEIKTELSDNEISIIARLKFLCDELDLDNFRKALTYFMELRLSKGRKSRKEFIDAIKKDNQFSGFGQNMGGFNSGFRQ